MPTDPIIIAGTGQAGLQAAASLRQGGYDGPVLMIGDEPGLPYQRPPLSKAYLKEGDADRLLLRAEAFFHDNDIALMDAARIARIDRRARSVTLESGSDYAYEHLVLCVGARNRRLPIEGHDLANVVELRTMAHADRLREGLQKASHAIVIGGGFIGLEFASVAGAHGCEVTVLEAAPRLMGRAVGEDTSRHFLEAHRAAGATVRLGTAVSRILSDDRRRATGVELADGETILGDLVLIAAGAVPNVELAADAGLAVDNGIAVDGVLSTGDPAISAIGDCASFIAAQSGTRIRLESVQNAVDQAKCVAARLAGNATPYDALPWFWSDQGPHKLQIAGLTAGADDHVVKEHETGGLSVFCFSGDRFIGLETVNVPAAHMAARKVLGAGGDITRRHLEETGFDLRALSKALAGRR